MEDTPAGVPGPGERPERRRRSSGARVVALLVIVAAVVILVVQNSQLVRLRFWFISGHLRLIWVILGSLVIGGAIGFLLGGRGRRRRRRRRARAE